jgi:hypothetical protein
LETQILLGGHSHMLALVGDRYSEAPTLREHETQPAVRILDGRWPRDEVYWREFVAAAAGRTVGLMWGGNEHNSIYFFQRAYRFDFSSEHVSRFLSRAQIVTQRTVRKRFLELSLNDMETLLKALAGAGARKVALLGTPPPKYDNEKLRKLLDAEPVLVQWARTAKIPLDEVAITDPLVRLKLWHLLQDMFREAAARYGFSYIGTPPEAQDADGFLREELWAPDVTHANMAYGALMFAKVIEELQR